MWGKSRKKKLLARGECKIKRENNNIKIYTQHGFENNESYRDKNGILYKIEFRAGYEKLWFKTCAIVCESHKFSGNDGGGGVMMATVATTIAMASRLAMVGHGCCFVLRAGHYNKSILFLILLAICLFICLLENKWQLNLSLQQQHTT